jgi:outer membrane protein assembly factor BamB
VNSSPALGSDGTIYFGAGSTTSANGLFAIQDNSTAAVKKWQFATTGAVLSSPLVAPNGRIYVGSSGDTGGGRVYVLTDGGTSATKVAEFTTGGAVRSSPAAGADGSVYVGADDNNLYALTADGTLKWRFSTAGQIVSAPAIGGDGTIYFGSRDRRIYGVSDQASSGQQVLNYLTGRMGPSTCRHSVARSMRSWTRPCRPSPSPSRPRRKWRSSARP